MKPDATKKNVTEPDCDWLSWRLSHIVFAYSRVPIQTFVWGHRKIAFSVVCALREPLFKNVLDDCHTSTQKETNNSLVWIKSLFLTNNTTSSDKYVNIINFILSRVLSLVVNFSQQKNLLFFFSLIYINITLSDPIHTRTLELIQRFFCVVYCGGHLTIFYVFFFLFFIYIFWRPLLCFLSAVEGEK